MKIKRKVLCFFMIVVLAAMLFIQSAFATLSSPAMDVDDALEIDNVQLSTLDLFDVSIHDAETVIPLYNADDTVIAYSIEGENNFTIIDLNGMVIVQNLNSNSPFFEIEDRVYINGPMAFYIKRGEQYVNLMDEQEILEAADFSDNIIVCIQNDLQNNYIAQADQALPATTSTITDKHLPYTPRGYYYNPTGICMGTAGATLIAYYRDHVNSNIASARHINSDGVGLTILLAEGSYYRYTTGSAASRAAQVLNWYMTVHGTTSYTASYSDTSSSFFSTIKAKINANRPLQAHFKTTSINHSVMVWGYREDSSNSNNNGIYCTYGWSSSYMDVYVNMNYVYGLIWINA